MKIRIDEYMSDIGVLWPLIPVVATLLFMSAYKYVEQEEALRNRGSIKVYLSESEIYSADNVSKPVDSNNCVEFTTQDQKDKKFCNVTYTFTRTGGVDADNQ